LFQPNDIVTAKTDVVSQIKDLCVFKIVRALDKYIYAFDLIDPIYSEYSTIFRQLELTYAKTPRAYNIGDVVQFDYLTNRQKALGSPRTTVLQQSTFLVSRVYPEYFGVELVGAATLVPLTYEGLADGTPLIIHSRRLCKVG
jgi:hypothetical protein